MLFRSAETTIDVLTDLTQTFTDSETPVQLFAGAVTLGATNIGTLATSLVAVTPLLKSFKDKFGVGFIALLGKWGLAVGVLAVQIGVLADSLANIIEAFKNIPTGGKYFKSQLTGQPDNETPVVTSWDFIPGTTKWRQMKQIEAMKNETNERNKQIDAIDKQNESLKKLDKTKGGTPRGGDSPQVEDAKQELDLLVLANKEYDELKKSIEANLLNVGAMVDLREQELEIIKKISYLETGREEAKQITRFKGSKSGAFGGVNIGGVAQMPEPDKLFEMMTIMDAVRSSTEALGNSLSGLFTGLIQGGENAVDALKQTMKTIVNTFITSIQAMILASTGGMFAKAITTFGISLITDAPWLASAWAGLEAAKGVIGGLEKGGTAEAGTPYIVGEKGQELFIPNQSGTVLSNKDTMKLLTGIGGQTPIVNNYFSVESDFINVMEKNMPIYNQRKYAKR